MNSKLRAIRPLIWLVALICSSLTLLAVSAQNSVPTVRDASGKLVAIPNTLRIIAIGSGIAETIYALRAEHRLIGVDTSSNYPLAATRLAQVGARRAISSEGVLALRPTLVIATDESGPALAFEQMGAAGVTVLILKDETTIAGAKNKILAVAKALSLEARGVELVRGIDRDLALARVYATRITTRPKVMFLYSSSQGALTVSGTGTAADAMIALAGGVNVVSGYSGYKPINAESVAAANPDVIAILERGLIAIGGLENLLKAPGIAATNAGKSKRVVTFEGTYLLGFSPRVGQAVLDFTFALHPEVKRP